MTTADWPEILCYAAWATVLVIVLIGLAVILARWLVGWKFRKHFPSAMPFMYEDPWRTYGRSWWGRVKAWWRRRWRG